MVPFFFRVNEMPASMIFGKMGSNKTHFATFYAIYLANKLHKRIVFNYLLHPDNLMQYCSKMRYEWLVDALSKKQPIVYYCDVENGGLDHLLSIHDSVVVFDEVALYVPSRGSGSVTTKTSKFHKDLTQIRHRHNYLIVIAQNHQQIDSSIKNLSEETFHCAGLTLYDDKLKSQKLWFKIVNRFVPDNYEVWISNPRLRRNPIKTKIMSNKSFSGILTLADLDLFNVYQSFGLVHEIELSQAFPDSKSTYYVDEKLKKSPTFTWAYILPIEAKPITSKVSYFFYAKIPSMYCLLYQEVLSRLPQPVFKKSSNNFFNKVMLCALLVLALIIFLSAIKNFWFTLLFLSSPFLLLRLFGRMQPVR